MSREKGPNLECFLAGGFSPTPLKKYAYRQNGFIFPKFRGENKTYLNCHHLDIMLVGWLVGWLVPPK